MGWAVTRAMAAQDSLGLHLQHPKSPQSRSSNQSLSLAESSAKGVAFSLGSSVHKNVTESNIKALASCVNKTTNTPKGPSRHSKLYTLNRCRRRKDFWKDQLSPLRKAYTLWGACKWAKETQQRLNVFWVCVLSSFQEYLYSAQLECQRKSLSLSWAQVKSAFCRVWWGHTLALNGKKLSKRTPPLW